jgi:hypothetical protein
VAGAGALDVEDRRCDGAAVVETGRLETPIIVATARFVKGLAVGVLRRGTPHLHLGAFWWVAVIGCCDLDERQGMAALLWW